MGPNPSATCFDDNSLPYSLSTEDAHRIIPAVLEQHVHGGRLSLKNGYNILVEGDSLDNEKVWLAKYLKNDFDLVGNSQGVKIHLIRRPASCQKDEDYQLEIKDEVYITASSAKGVFYGIQSLRQLMIVESECCSLPHITVKDNPCYPWRAYMLDESRVFQGKEVVKKMLDEMARLKMNVFHWHLTDDQGWRIEIKQYPKLCEIGARRDSTQLNGWRGTTFDGKVHEGYYTQK